jgi:hypothetical protein
MGYLNRDRLISLFDLEHADKLEFSQIRHSCNNGPKVAHVTEDIYPLQCFGLNAILSKSRDKVQDSSPIT